jgi:hypothetical protein
MNKLPFSIDSIRVTFTIPKWFPQDRFDYSRINDSGDRLYINQAENTFFKRFPDCSELCGGVSATFEIGYVSGIHLDAWIKDKRRQLYRFFVRYKEWDKSISSNPEFILKCIG